MPGTRSRPDIRDRYPDDGRRLRRHGGEGERSGERGEHAGEGTPFEWSNLKPPPASPNPLVMKVAALLLASFAALTVLASASAATPAGYREHVNSICAANTPTMQRLIAQLASAQKARDGRAFGAALGKLLVVQLAEDAQVEKVAVPAELRARMSPILARMRSLDDHGRRVLAAAKAGDGATMGAELKHIDRLSKPLNTWLDSAGLRECGSKQS